jgi:hypothetical protein
MFTEKYGNQKNVYLEKEFLIKNDLIIGSMQTKIR